MQQIATQEMLADCARSGDFAKLRNLVDEVEARRRGIADTLPTLTLTPVQGDDGNGDGDSGIDMTRSRQSVTTATTTTTVSALPGDQLTPYSATFQLPTNLTPGRYSVVTTNDVSDVPVAFESFLNETCLLYTSPSPRDRG